MSGGYFDYNQYRINDIIDTLEDVIGNYGTEHTGCCGELSEDTYQKFQVALQYLELASIYTQRIDWLLSGDDSEESFNERLQDDLDEYFHGIELGG